MDTITEGGRLKFYNKMPRSDLVQEAVEDVQEGILSEIIPPALWSAGIRGIWTDLKIFRVLQEQYSPHCIVSGSFQNFRVPGRNEILLKPSLKHIFVWCHLEWVDYYMGDVLSL